MEIVTNEQELHTKSEIANENEAGGIVSQLSTHIPQTALGLAAPQLGIFKRIFIARLEQGLLAFINPELTWTSPDLVPSIESCLSIPNVTRCVNRHNQVNITCSKVVNISIGSSISNPSPIRLKGLDSCVVQHELDHLNGVLITDLPIALTREEKSLEKQRQRLSKLGNQRNAPEIKPVTKQAKLNEVKLQKLEREKVKMKKRARREKKREKISVETQERYKLELLGLTKQPSSSTEK